MLGFFNVNEIVVLQIKYVGCICVRNQEFTQFLYYAIVYHNVYSDADASSVENSFLSLYCIYRSFMHYSFIHL